MFKSEKLKKAVAGVSLVAALFVTTQLSYQKKANAFLILSAVGDYPWATPVGVTGLVLSCIFLLPLCILDEQNKMGVTVDQNLLAENGYSPSEIKTIMQDVVRTTDLANASKAKAFVSADTTRTGLAADLKQINPAISEVTINVLADTAGLK